MLTHELITRIALYIESEMAPREQSLGRALLDVQSRHVRNGTLGSSMAVQGYARAGCDEMAVRAESIWKAIHESHSSLVGLAEPGTLQDLREQVQRHVEAQERLVVGLCNERLGPARQLRQPQFQGLVDRDIRQRTAQLVAGIDIKIQFYIDSLNRKSAAVQGGATYNFHGSVGAVQTGANATANVQLNAGDRDQLLAALDTLRQAIATNGEIADAQRGQTIEVVDAAAEALRAERPNPSMILALMNGVATTVQTVASLRPAWELVRDILTRAGFG
jgi:hypothetical protein